MVSNVEVITEGVAVISTTSFKWLTGYIGALELWLDAQPSFSLI